MKHPENLESVNSITVTEDLKEFVSTLSKDVEQALSDRADWNNRDDIYYRKRYGLRAKRTHPWPGAANFVLPLIDADKPITGHPLA